jgi:outer membrane protein assembly factor BamB
MFSEKRSQKTENPVTRRGFLGASAAGVAALAAAQTAEAARIDVAKIRVRTAGKPEIAFKSPGPQPNGLQATPEGLWIIDQGPGNKAFLVSYDDGRVLRSFDTETDKSSGITYENGTLWIGSTYSREIVHIDAMTGKTLDRKFTPGAGIIYKMLGDPPARSSPLAKARPRPAAKTAGRGQQVGGFQMGQVQGAAAPGTGAHGQEWRDGKLWFAVPPSREIYRIDPKEWVVEAKFPSAGNRPHGIGWEGRYLWVTDSNWNAFFKHDPETGDIVEKIQLADSDPLPHGMTIWQGNMWYCDDVGVVCRLKL